MPGSNYNITAVLQARDSSFSSTMRAAAGSLQSLKKESKGFGSGLKQALGGTLVFQGVTKGLSMISNSLGSAISRFDTLNNFPIMMQNLGYSADDASASIQKMSDGIDGLPTALDDIAGSVTKIAPLTGSLDKATDITLAMNNALLAGGKSMDIQANALEQYSQMLSYGKVDMQSWKSMMNAMPGQLNQLSQKLLGAGKSGMDLYEAMKKGTVTFDQFNDALLDLNENGMDGFASFQDQAVSATQGIGTALKNIKTAVTKGLTDTIQTLSDSLKGAGLGSIADNLNRLKGGIKNAFKGINGVLGRVVPAAVKALMSLAKQFSPVAERIRKEAKFLRLELSSTGKAFKEAFKKNFGDVDMSSVAEKIATGIAYISRALGTLMEFLKKNADVISKWLPKIVGGFVAFKLVSKFATPIVAFAKALGSLRKAKGAGDALSGASNGMRKVNNASSMFLKTAAGIFLIATAFAMLSQSAVAVANTKGAIGVLIGLGVAFGAVALGISKLVEGLGFFNPKKIAAIGNTFLKIGAGVFLVAAGFALLAGAAAYLASQGGLAIAVFAGMAVVMAGLLFVVSTLGAGLTAAAPGMLAFGAAMLMCGAGALLASAGLYIVAGVLPTIAEHGTAAAGAIVALGGAMLVFGAGALVAGAGLLVLTAGMVGLTVGLVALTAGIAAFSAGLLLAAGGAAVFAGAMKLVQTTVKGIASSAKSAAKSIKEMVSGVNVVKTGLGTLGSLADGAINTLKSAFDGLKSSLPSIAQSAVTGMNSALQSGFSRAQSMAAAAAAGILARLRMASSGAFYAGAMIGSGLANGMQSQLGRVQSIAASLAAAANRAIAAKAQIGSPSKITTYYGKMEGQGFINGMKRMKSGITKTAEDVFAVGQPARSPMPQPDGKAFYNGDPEITTVLAIDGRKFAKATSRNIRNQNSVEQRRENRKVGVV